MQRDIVVDGLLERDEQLRRVAARIEAVNSGSGSLLGIAGPAGIGKSSVLRVGAEHARGCGLEVLTASGEDLERELGHGVTRQLFDPALAQLGEAGRARLFVGAAALAAPVLGLPAPSAPASIDPEFAVRHGLTWLLAGLAERRPILIVLDDAQWADAPALRWLAYLAARLDQLPVVVLLARRSGEAGTDDPALDALCAAGEQIQLAPLSDGAVAELVRVRTGLSPDAELVANCVSASGGNPFLLDATLAALDEEGLSSFRQPLSGARRVAPTILRRLARLPSHAGALATAVAVLGNGVDLASAARLAGLPLSDAAAAADALVAADLLSPGEQLGFTHGLVRDAVAGELGQHAMRAAHAQAALVLRDLGAPAQRIATHLLLAPGQRDPAAAADLREAARVSLARGAATSAVTLLRRALAEPPPPSEHADVLLELGMAELVGGAPGAPERLGAAIELLDDPVAQASAAQAQTMALIGQARLHDAIDTIERARRAVAGHERELVMLDALQLILALTSIDLDAEREGAVARLRVALRSARPDAAETRGAALLLAAVDAIAGTASSVVRAAVERAWGDGALLDALGPEHVFCMFGGVTLLLARQLSALEKLTTQVADRAASSGSVTGACHAWMLRAAAREAMGRLADAEADVELTLQMSAPASLNNAQHIANAIQTRICIERGDIAGARTHLARADPETGNFLSRVAYFTTAASLARADSAPAAERRALRQIQTLAGDGEFGTWLLGCWPADLAIALGPCDEARQLATHALHGARARAISAEMGISLRAHALVDGERADIERLRAAVVELEHSDMALEHARTLVDLGAALRRLGHRSDARQPLADGLDHAVRCGATALAKRAQTELQATGARPRRLLVTGRDALTPSERRIATLAAAGRSNRDIAQTLFVTTKTVETHLSRTYRKLDITSRTQLSAALAQI